MEKTKEKRLSRLDIIKGKAKLSDEDINLIIELRQEHIPINNLKKYTDKDFRDLTEKEKEKLINELLSSEKYIRYKNCHIAESKLLYDTSETLAKETEALSCLDALGFEIYLLPYAYARDNMNCFQKSADSITEGDFLEMKSVVSTGKTAGESAYKDARYQADNVYLSIVNETSEGKIINNIYRSIGAIKDKNKKNNIENNFKGMLFLNFEKNNKTSLYKITKDGQAIKLSDATPKWFKKKQGNRTNRFPGCGGLHGKTWKST